MRRIAYSCSFAECGRAYEAKGYCSGHNKQLGRGLRLTPIQQYRKKGTGYIDRQGYVQMQINGRKGGEHRFVYEKILGRELLPGENVHHINGVRDDNRPENLELWVTSQPSGQRVEDKVAWAKEILARYDPSTSQNCSTTE